MALNIIKKNYLIFLIWLVIIGSLGSKWKYDIQIISLNELINLVRFLSFLIIPLSLYFYFKVVKNYKFKNNFVLNCFYLVFLFQLIGFANFYFFNEILFFRKTIDNDLITNGYNVRFSYSFFTSLSLIIPLPIIGLLLNRKKFSSELLKISILFLSIITTLYLIKVFYEFIQSDKIYFYYLGFLVWGDILSVPAPRATGISRWLLILYIFCLSFYLVSKKKNHLFYLLMIFTGTFIYLFQSRTSIYFLFTVTFIIFFKDKYYIKNLIKIIFIFISIYLLSTFIVQFKHYTNVQKLKNEIASVEKNIDKTENPDHLFGLSLKKEQLEKRKNIYRENQQSRNFGQENNFSTGRTEIWKKLFNYVFNTKLSNSLLGFGAQSDRYLSGQNASNGGVYLLISAGIIGFILYLLICLNTTLLIYKLIKFKKKILEHKQKYALLVFSILCLIFLMCRSLVEISFMSFGLDYLLFLVCFLNLHNFVKSFENNQNKNF
jgi:hypothetical protein